MDEHKFKIGQTVHFRPKKSRFPVDAASGPYRITKRLPAADGEFQYMIRSESESHERVARESELSRF
jgi:hypothetical protein